jgi:RNA polymerase subunit RPABC4/transcription elongation factor Spt4
MECQWCNATLPNDADECPVCGSKVAAAGVEFPGLTALYESDVALDRPIRAPGERPDMFLASDGALTMVRVLVRLLGRF